MLYIVSTPIGNLKDITLRALEVLKSVDLVACEDTRHTGLLLKHFNINKPLLSYHSYNQPKSIDKILSQLKEGADVALVSDSGTPGISDPGFLLIRAAIQAGIKVAAIPGPSAAITALCASGMPTDRFYFAGFLSNKQTRRRVQLEELKKIDATLIIYESCHRILQCLKDILDIFGDVDICLSRELTKKFEEIRREKVSLSLAHVASSKIRGEFIIILRPPK